jgi:glycosyltransferase involved in cell wall biosynthesis
MTGTSISKVSVCIPVYNGSAYIAESINSVLAQTYEDFHLIVCDNCSTDNTEEIVRSFHDPRLTYVRNSENLGLVGNANRCIELSKGEYVCIWHHDDVMLPDNLQCKVHLLDEHPEVGFVHSNLILIDDTGETIAPEIWGDDSRRDYIEGGLTTLKKYLSKLPLGARFFIGAVLARRKCYKKLGGFNPKFPHCNDSEMWIRMMLFYNVGCIGTPLLKYRVHPISTSSYWGDHTSLPYIREHYQVARLIFIEYENEIPQVNILKRNTFLSFGNRALQLANIAINKGDFYTAKMFFKEAVEFSPHIVKKESFWKTALKIAAGPKGIRLSQIWKKYIYPNAQ